MKQICKFNNKPATINNGGYKKGRWIVWLNLSISEIEPTESQSETFQSVTDRLVLNDFSVAAFVDAVDPLHLALATNEEIYEILKYFNELDELESWKTLLKVQIQGYDSSNKVNQFFLNQIPFWIDKATRVGLVNSLNMEKGAGRAVSTLWVEGRTIQLPVDLALGLLQALELYALDCYGVTATHLSYVEGSQSIQELRDFNKEADYPEMLRFKISE